MDFLSSFNFDTDNSAASGVLSCASVEDLQLRLRDALTEKATPTRAEHVDITLDIGAAARLTLSLSTTENSVLDGLGDLDPALGGLRSESATTETSGEQSTRSISATDVLMNQPQDDPVLQRAVARHISSAVSATDGSSWIMREMSRDSQGWNFTYLCKDSSQQWGRQNAGRTKLIIGEYSQREMDPILMSRPAFDCRGTLRIAFARGGRSISVKYGHTPLHKTVAEVAELFRPPPRPVVLRIPDVEKQRSPKKPPSARKKRDSTKALDENGNPRKRKKNAPEAQPHVAEAHEQPSSDQGDTQLGQGSLQLSDGVAAAGSAEGAAQIEQGPHKPSAAVNFPLNLSPEETARRQDAAKKLLSEAGVESETLSLEQFGIFANQSPDLQRESLSMLVKYGAERLRIVHPSNRDSSASARPIAMATSIQNTNAAPSEPMTTTELVPRASGSADETEGTPAGSKRRKLGKSRTACFQCKRRQVKCPKERPTCVECQVAGVTCEYAPPKPRKRKSKSGALVPEHHDTEGDSLLSSAPLQETSEGEAQEDPPMALPVDQPGAEDMREQDPEDGASPAEEPQDGQLEEDRVEEGDEVDYSSYPQIPVSDMLTRNVDIQNHTTQPMHQPQLPYFRSASGLVLPQAEEPPVTQNMQTPSPGLVLPPGAVHFSPNMTSTAADTSPLRSRADEPPRPSAFSQQTQHAPNGPRRSLPSVPPQNRGNDDAPMPAGAVSGWLSSANSISRAVSSQQSNTRSAGEPSPRGSDNRFPAASPQMQDAAALSRAALEHQKRQSQSLRATLQPSAQTSSFDGLRAKSRQGQRAQMTTPGGLQSFQAPPPAESPPRGKSASNNQYRPTTLNMNSASSFSVQGNYSESGTNTPAVSDKIGYEPYSYQRSIQGTASHPTYEYGRATSATMSMENPSTTSMASPYPGNALELPDSMPASRVHDMPSRTHSPYNNNTSTAKTVMKKVNEVHAPNSELNLRNTSQAARHGQAHGQGYGPSNKYQHQQHHPRQQQRQQQPQGQQQSTQGHQEQNWYNLDDPHSSYPFGLQRSNYHWKMSDGPW